MLQRVSAAFRIALASSFLAGTVFVAAPIRHADASAGDRALNLYNVHTQQTATIVFKRNGRYDPAGLKQLNYILRDWRKDQPTNMDPHLFDLIWQVYQQSGSRVPIHVVCGYRSPSTNAMLRSRSRMVAEHSQHMLGKAMDFFLPDVPLPKLRAIGLRMQVGGVGFYPTSGSPFVHMDTGSVRHWPKMTRDQLVRIFPDGKTLHIPSDGRPLPGYEQALAEYKARKANGGTIMMASADTSSGKSKSWLGRLLGGGGGGADEQQDAEDTLPDAKAADAAAVAADEAPRSKAPVPQAKPALVAPAIAADEQPETVVAAIAPIPRPSPIQHAAEDATPAVEPTVVAEADIVPPTPRASPIARPMVAQASITGTGISGHAAAARLAALNAPLQPKPAPAVMADASVPKTAADAIADAVGDKNNEATPVLAYASAEDGAPHIDAVTGALVAGRSSGQMTASLSAPEGVDRSSESASDWVDPLARLTPVGYSSDTIELVMRSGSTRQIAYAEMEMPHPFGVPELFSAPHRSVRLGFGRIAYEGLRTDRFSGPLVRPLGTQDFAQNDTYKQTASLKR